jgi:hypothetical protein
VNEHLNRCDNLEDEEEFLSLFLLTRTALNWGGRREEKQNKFAANGIFILQSLVWCVRFDGL